MAALEVDPRRRRGPPDPSPGLEADGRRPEASDHPRRPWRDPAGQCHRARTAVRDLERELYRCDCGTLRHAHCQRGRHRADRGRVRRGRRPREARPDTGETRRLGHRAAGQPSCRFARAGACPGGTVGRRVPARARGRSRRGPLRGRHRKAPRHRGDGCGERQSRRRTARRGAGAPRPNAHRRARGGHGAYAQGRGRSNRKPGR